MGASTETANTRAVVVVPTAGGEPREVVRGTAAPTPQLWTRDSQALIVRRGTEMLRVKLDGSEPLLLNLTVDPAWGQILGAVLTRMRTERRAKRKPAANSMKPNITTSSGQLTLSAKWRLA